MNAVQAVGTVMVIVSGAWFAAKYVLVPVAGRIFDRASAACEKRLADFDDYRSDDDRWRDLMAVADAVQGPRLRAVK